MLSRLNLENFALVDKLEVIFGSGMNVLTGETGAGKSVIVGAISKLLGEKADKDDIRSGAELAVIEGDFDIIGNKRIKTMLAELDIDINSDVITLRRELPLGKPSRSFINNRLVTLTQLRPIAAQLAELFGQHSHQLLLDEKSHLAFLDNFAGISSNAERMRESYIQWEHAKKELARLISCKEHENRERELLIYQKKEIEKADIHAGEEEQLLAEKKILDSSQLIAEKSQIILSFLDRNEPSVLELISSILKEFSQIADLDKSLSQQKELLEQAAVNLEEFRGEIEAYHSSIQDDPGRLEEINIRLDELYRLKKKYGGSEESILSALEKIDRQLESRIDTEQKIKALEIKEKEHFENYTATAIEISKIRHKTSGRLSNSIEKELAQLGIDSARFQFEFISEDDDNGIKVNDRFVKPTPDGLENGRFLVSANPGEPLKPLAKTASGGEISRIMLALKSATRKTAKSDTGLLVFDEIDVGIGGKTAHTVAKKLASIAEKYQLLVVTHLHQIAVAGGYHYAVQKVNDTKNTRKTVMVRRLGEPEKAGEIDRMISMPARKTT
jgi:DNA repair protein RecN (Recombination protein N)